MTNDLSIIKNPNYIKAIEIIYQVLKYMQLPSYIVNSNINSSLEYSFERFSYVPTDTLIHGVGPPSIYTGLIRSAFRPADDATRLPFLIPANAFAVVAFVVIVSFLPFCVNFYVVCFCHKLRKMQYILLLKIILSIQLQQLSYLHVCVFTTTTNQQQTKNGNKINIKIKIK